MEIEKHREEERYREIDHTADTGIEVFGSSLKELFTNAATGFVDTLTDPENIEPKDSLEISVRAGDIEELLVAWLSELLYFFDIDRVLFAEFHFEELSATRLRARLGGEPFEASSHPIKTDIKAVTYHGVRR